MREKQVVFIANAMSSESGDGFIFVVAGGHSRVGFLTEVDAVRPRTAPRRAGTAHDAPRAEHAGVIGFPGFGIEGMGPRGRDCVGRHDPGRRLVALDPNEGQGVNRLYFPFPAVALFAFARFI